MANNLPDAFTNIRGVSESHIPAANAPERVEIPMEGINSSQILKPRKRGREPDDSMQAQRRRPQGRDNREQAVDEGPSALARTTISNGTRASEQPVISNMGNQDELDELNEEIATNYAKSRELYNRKTIVVHINFISKIAEIIDEDSESKSMAECQERSDWVQWKEAIETELRSLNKRQVFGPVARTPPKYFRWDTNGYLFKKGTRIMWW